MSNVFFEVLDSYHESSPNREAVLAAITTDATPELSQEARQVLSTCLSYPPGCLLSGSGLHLRASFPSINYVEGALQELKDKGYLRERNPETQWPGLYATAHTEPAPADATPEPAPTPKPKKAKKDGAA